VFVHLADSEEKAQKFFAQHKMPDVAWIADPQGDLYQAFGLLRASWRQYLNYESIVRMIGSSLKGNWSGAPAGDVQRMPGVFLIEKGEVRKAFRHKLVSDRPNYLELATAT
jgi:hypothetical protein